MVEQARSGEYDESPPSLDLFGRPRRPETTSGGHTQFMADIQEGTDEDDGPANLDLFGHPKRREATPGGRREAAPVESEPTGTDPDEFEQFTVTNPQGTVSVSALMGGRTHRIDLSAKATDLTERELAEEIIVIAQLARHKARSAQHVLMHQTAGETTDQDPRHRPAMPEFVSKLLNLPTPAAAAATEAKVFATRYAGDRD